MRPIPTAEHPNLVRDEDGVWLAFAPEGSGRPTAMIRPSWWKPSRPKVPAEIRIQILERDSYTCQQCGSTDEPQVDHIYPLSRGGALADPENLQVLCGPCNRRKSARLPGED